MPDDGIAGDDGSGSDDEYSDDDDVTWKVRKKGWIEAVIISRHEKIEQFYRTVSPALITRYLGVIFQQLCNADFSSGSRKGKKMWRQTFSTPTYQALLRQTKPPSNVSINQDPNSMDAEEGPVTLRQAQVPNILKVL